jgi:hypothetical protein
VASSRTGGTLLTSLALIGLGLASTEPAAPESPQTAESRWSGERWSVGTPVEVDLVGLAVGLHPEVLYRPFKADGGFHLRAAAGVMAGPELTLLSPLALGIRQELFPRRRVQPGLGTGIQWQSFAVYGDHVHHRLDMYMELAVHVQVHEDYDVGLQLSPEIGMMGVGGEGAYSTFGLGMAVRLNVQRNTL